MLGEMFARVATRRYPASAVESLGVVERCDKDRSPAFGRAAQLSWIAAATVSCAPTVDVLGVYFPGWLVSAVAGFVVAYAVVITLSRRAATRALANSGLFFVGLMLATALASWWLLFSRF